MDSLLNQFKAQASQLDQGGAQPRLGVVSSVNPANSMVRVMIQPENVLSGWLPVSSIWVGAGWGIICLPSPGDQVLLLWQEGNAEHGIVVARLWSDIALPPPAPVGELWLLHKSGSSVKLTNDGSIASSAPTWRHVGNLVVTGDVSDKGGSLARLRGHYDEHTHPPASAAPTPLD